MKVERVFINRAGGILMNILLSGGTGFAGKSITKLLTEKGHDVFILTRNPDKKNQPHVTYIKWLANGTA